MNNLKRKLSTFSLKQNKYHFLKKNFFFEKKYISSNKKNEKITKENCQILPNIILETEIFFEFKEIFYRGFNLCDLCKMSTFDEIIFLLLYGRLANLKELDEKKNYFESIFRNFDERKIFKINEILENSNFLELLRICMFNFSLLEKNNNDINLSYYKILACSLRLIMVFYSNKKDHLRINEKKFDNFCSFFIENCDFRWKTMKKDIENTTYEKDRLNENENKIKKEKIKLLNILLILICENNINEKTFLIRMISNINDNYFNICLSAVTFYIDIFKKIDFNSSLESFLNFEFSPNNITKYEMDKKSNINFFFYRNCFFLKKSNILKQYLVKYCSNTYKSNLDILNHFMKIENFFLKCENKYASSYYYTLLTFYLLDISAELLPVLYFLSRLLSFTTHINEQKKNNKIIKYSSTYIGNPPMNYIDINQR
ncbi:citrate synthase-like protein, putative [Plasmodium gallinaceum]|uniref:Citrate synthase-like protein, putative n=1 Tax=Plasmodium gallinaceum TaxID=5849 RepID=A0A1J1GMN7_PLAGA|nr:citrate synthase-like protein, putative [Plasmodium gallinaceum]CRG93673.1 citrate synthase-like protein, putative [Plasmodium gallinaceum]